ncbi:hypothetical protein KHA80_21420 [Anaerobacillus sp. HL2]|nr:hypothetical protein KHA80_21420 [Anaerobacillus sp. HL2]
MQIYSITNIDEGVMFKMEFEENVVKSPTVVFHLVYSVAVGDSVRFTGSLFP